MDAKINREEFKKQITEAKEKQKRQRDYDDKSTKKQKRLYREAEEARLQIDDNFLLVIIEGVCEYVIFNTKENIEAIKQASEGKKVKMEINQGMDEHHFDRCVDPDKTYDTYENNFKKLIACIQKATLATFKKRRTKTK
jgi:hypothetical protein